MKTNANQPKYLKSGVGLFGGEQQGQTVKESLPADPGLRSRVLKSNTPRPRGVKR